MNQEAGSGKAGRQAAGAWDATSNGQGKPGPGAKCCEHQEEKRQRRRRRQLSLQRGPAWRQSGRSLPLGAPSRSVPGRFLGGARPTPAPTPLQCCSWGPTRATAHCAPRCSTATLEGMRVEMHHGLHCPWPLPAPMSHACLLLHIGDSTLQCRA